MSSAPMAPEGPTLITIGDRDSSDRELGGLIMPENDPFSPEDRENRLPDRLSPTEKSSD